MKLHSRARTSPFQRRRIATKVASGEWTIKGSSRTHGISARTVRKWVHRAKREEPLVDRSSRRATSPLRISDDLKALMLSMRRFRLTAQQISDIVHVPRSTVSRLLRANGMSRLRQLKDQEPVVRYEAENPGDLVHLDIKKLGRIDGVGHRITGDRKHRSHAGWEYAFVAVDDHSRVAHVELFRAETAASAVRFLHGVIERFRQLGITIKAILTDNGSPFVARVFGAACQRFRIRHKRTRPYRPQTNGKAERFVQTVLREWAYVRAYRSSAERSRALGPFLRHYNYRRRHAGIAGTTPISRITSRVNNLVRNDS